MRMATEILRLRMSGVSHQEALAQVSEQLACGISVLGEAWSSYKHYAVVLLRKERPLERYPWTDQEAHRLREIFDRKRTAPVRKNRLIKPTRRPLLCRLDLHRRPYQASVRRSRTMQALKRQPQNKTRTNHTRTTIYF